MGKGNYAFGANSTLTEGDTLFIIAFFQIAFFVLYLINKERKYLILWLIYLLFLIFSYRRSALGVALSANVLCYLLIVLKKKGIKNKIILVLGIVLIYGVLSNVEQFNLPYKYERYILRFVSAIPGMNLSDSGEFTDSGHWEQTSKTFYSAFQNLGFWGVGYGRSYDVYLAGQSSVIHNVYAATWAQHGLYMLLFYLFIIFIVLFTTLKLFLYEKIHNNNYYIIKISLCIFLLMWFAVLITNPLIIAETFKMQVFWFTLFTVTIRLSPDNTCFLFGNKSYIKNRNVE